MVGSLPSTIFKNAHSVTDDIKAAGVEVFRFIHTKWKKKELSLNDLRLQKFNIICGKGKLHPERLPPTQGAAEMHALRVCWQFQEWANLSHLDPSEYGWKKVNNEYYLIGTLNDIAPEGLFNFISCKWEKGSAAA